MPVKLADRSVPFTVLGVGVAFALVALPAPDRNDGEIAGAAVLGVSLVALSFCWRRIPRTTQLVVPLGYLALAALLRLSDGGAASGFGGLYFLPILWLALSGDRRELLIGLVALTLVEIVPIIAIGAPRYPVDSWRPGVVRVSVATIIGFTIQQLLAETRARARDATRWSQRLESLNEVGNALATETKLQPLLDLVAARLRELLGARVVAVLLPDGPHKLRFAAVAGADGHALVGTKVSRDGTRSGLALDRSRSERAASGPGEPPIDADFGGRASLWVPLVVRDRSIGVISVHDKVDGDGPDFSDDDLLLAETFASRAAVAVDLSERVARDSLQRVVEAQEIERQRLARELHDQTGQTLTSIMLGLKAVEERLPDDPTRGAVAALGQQVASAMQDVRRIALELRPKVLDDYGLVSALERLTRTFSARTGIPVDLEARLSRDERLPAEIETALYRIVQEGLTNIAKHADPTRASVLVTPKNGSVVLVVEDNGNGFDPAAAHEEGLGIDGMRERVALLEGRLTIESGKEAGTTLVVEVPVN